MCWDVVVLQTTFNISISRLGLEVRLAAASAFYRVSISSIAFPQLSFFSIHTNDTCSDENFHRASTMQQSRQLDALNMCDVWTEILAGSAPLLLRFKSLFFRTCGFALGGFERSFGVAVTTIAPSWDARHHTAALVVCGRMSSMGVEDEARGLWGMWRVVDASLKAEIVFNRSSFSMSHIYQVTMLC